MSTSRASAVLSVSPEASGVGTRVHRRRNAPLRHARWSSRRAQAPPLQPQSRPEALPRPAPGRPHGRDRILRCAGRRRATHHDVGANRRRPRRRAGHQCSCPRAIARGRARHGCARALSRIRHDDRRSRPARRQRHGRMDRLGAIDGGPLRNQRQGIQGHPPRGPAQSHRGRRRPHPPHREERALRDPVEAPLDHRNHRHRLESRLLPPRGQPPGHRLPASNRQHGARAAAAAIRHRGRLRRAAPAALRRERRDEQAHARARRVPGTAGAHHRGGRQVHHVPRDGEGRSRRRRGRPGPFGPRVVHRTRPTARRRRLRGRLEPARRNRQGEGSCHGTGRTPAPALRDRSGRGPGASRRSTGAGPTARGRARLSRGRGPVRHLARGSAAPR